MTLSETLAPAIAKWIEMIDSNHTGAVIAHSPELGYDAFYTRQEASSYNTLVVYSYGAFVNTSANLEVNDITERVISRLQINVYADELTGWAYVRFGTGDFGDYLQSFGPFKSTGTQEACLMAEEFVASNLEAKLSENSPWLLDRVYSVRLAECIENAAKA